ncbi:uncharacterized protein LOC131214329, partial [Anopheles bellator]|uniref:uncharacterized protein LOC131214329 n=1 Tax=Anopheles bellator TaxID=139047 RepID=UPI002648F5A7
RVYYSTAFSTLRGWTRRTIETISTIDIVGDGMDELFASGPKGLCLYMPTFNNDGFELANVFDPSIADLSIRYGLPKLASKGQGKDEHNVLLYTGEKLINVKTKIYQPKPDMVPYAESSVSKEDHTIPLLVPQPKYILWLHDHLDLTTLLQPLNPHSGTVDLSIPLIDIQNAYGVSVRKMVQYKNVPYVGCLGRGWSLSLDYITVDRKGSGFVQDHQYAILKNNNRILLKARPTRDKGYERHFTVDGYSSAQFIYYEDKQIWEVMMEDHKFVYGSWKNLSAYTTEKGCGAWPLCGKKSKTVRSLPSKWFLVHEENAAGNYANYYYDVLEGGLKYRLESIRLDNQCYVNFKYASDNKLTSFKLSTEAFEQNVSFLYDGNNLKEMKQEDKPLFKFEYENDRLLKIVYPNGMDVKLDYSVVAIDRKRLEEVIPVEKNPLIYYGPDYSVILATDDAGGTEHKAITIRTLLGGTDSTKVTKKNIRLGKPGIKNQTVFALEDLLVVVLIYEKYKEVTVLQHTSGNWVVQKQFDEFPLLGTIGAGKRFVVMCDFKTVQAISILESGTLDIATLQHVNHDDFLLREFVNGFVTYEEPIMKDGELTIWAKTQNDRWTKVKTVPKLHIFMEVERTTRMFEYTDELRYIFRNGVLADALTIYQNAVVMRAVTLLGQVLTINLHIVNLDFTKTLPEVSATQDVVITVADFRTYEYNMTTKDGDLFKLQYKHIGSAMKMSVKSSSGPIMNMLEDQRKKAYKEVDDSGANWNQKQQHKKEVDKSLNEELQKIYATVVEKVQFAMDLSQFGVLTNPNGIVTGNTQLTFDGETWHQKRIDERSMRLEQVDESLGGGFKLVRHGHRDTFKIYDTSRNKMVFDTETSNPNELQIVAPRYVQAQNGARPLRAYFFKTGETVTFPRNEKICRASNSVALLMVRSFGPSANYVIFRPVDSFLLKDTTVFSGQTVRLDAKETRVTSYLFDGADAHLSSEGAMFYRVRIAPGGNTTQYGWHEQKTDSITGKTTEKSFSGDGREVTAREKKDRDEQATTIDHETVIWDRSQQLKIVELGYFSVADQTISYYGFEDYEVNRYGAIKDNLSWKFNKRGIYLEGENHYLKLLHGQPMKGSFRPKNPLNVFIVSCWVRVGEDQSVRDTIDILKVDVVNEVTRERHSFAQAKIQHAIQNWYYIETIVDTMKYPQQSKLVIDITFEVTALHKTVCIDHVRFSPLDFNFRASIYTPVMGELRAMHFNNGLLKQSLYSPRCKRSILLSENGYVVDLALQSRAVFSEAIGARQSLVEMKPRKGVYDHFEESEWKTAKPLEWIFRYGTLTHKSISGKQGEILRPIQGPFNSVAIRFMYHLKSIGGTLSFKWNTHQIELICSATNQNCHRPSNIGEVLIFITPLRVSVWVEGSLISEQVVSTGQEISAIDKGELRLLPSGHLTFSEFFTLYDPWVKVTYHNRMGRPVQLIEYDSPRTVRIREILYDAIERPRIQTKWTKLMCVRDTFFGFHEEFVTGIARTTKRMTGQVSAFNPSCKGYPYSQTVYANDPTENKELQGLPGIDYTVQGKYKRRYSTKPEMALLRILFPEADGFRQKIVERPGSAIRATVEDLRGNKVAKYWKVGNYEDRLTTYTYDSNNHLIEELSPQYHVLAKTKYSRVPFPGKVYTAEEMKLKSLWKFAHTYDGDKLMTKRTPDGGSYEYIYNQHGILRFSLHYDRANKLDRVIHFSYAANKKLTREALVDLTRDKCINIVDSTSLPESNDLIESTYGEFDVNPMVRYRSQQSTRLIGANQMVESLIYDENEKVIKKIFVVPTINTTYSIDYEYENKMLHSISYPVDSA